MTTGHAEEAVASYNKLFNVRRRKVDRRRVLEYGGEIPARRGEAINQLKRINADAPGNTGLQNNLRYRRLVAIAVVRVCCPGTDGKSNAGREGALIWYGRLERHARQLMPCVGAEKYLLILVMAIAWRLRNRNWQETKTAGRFCFPRSAPGLAAVDLVWRQSIPTNNRPVRVNPERQ
ncbi:hypothetical protein ACLK1T_13760 [Escherichia coli]